MTATAHHGEPRSPLHRLADFLAGHPDPDIAFWREGCAKATARAKDALDEARIAHQNLAALQVQFMKLCGTHRALQDTCTGLLAKVDQTEAAQRDARFWRDQHERAEAEIRRLRSELHHPTTDGGGDE